MDDIDLDELSAFIVRAKAATYVGSGAEASSSRPGAHEIPFNEGRFEYLDSYVGGANFLGQEIVTYDGGIVWAMNYHGYLLRPDLITAAEAGAVIKESLSVLYAEGRFLGGIEHTIDGDVYSDTNSGDVSRFRGIERIERGGEQVYELVYHGGLVRE
jgi:hypothetical protein